MTHCPYSDSCRLYPLFRLRATLGTWKVRYCENTYQECERYKLAEQSRTVPDNLLPNGKFLTLGKARKPE